MRFRAYKISKADQDISAVLGAFALRSKTAS